MAIESMRRHSDAGSELVSTVFRFVLILSQMCTRTPPRPPTPTGPASPCLWPLPRPQPRPFSASSSLPRRATALHRDQRATLQKRPGPSAHRLWCSRICWCQGTTHSLLRCKTQGTLRHRRLWPVQLDALCCVHSRLMSSPYSCQVEPSTHIKPVPPGFHPSTKTHCACCSSSCQVQEHSLQRCLFSLVCHRPRAPLHHPLQR